MTRIDKAAAAVAAALLAAAVGTELRKPAGERTWHGRIAGVPYDLRPPTLEKLRTTVWDPGNPALVVPHGFGVGWTVNIARLVQLITPGRGRAPAGPSR